MTARRPAGGRRRQAAPAALVLTLAAGAPAQAEGFLPLGEIEPGQRGETRTVYAGDRVESVPLEILGVAPGFAGPGRDVILARLHGERAQLAGVASGMSGSPVLVDGRLVGALAYRIGSFTQEAIAGITPIEEMLALPGETSGPWAGAPAAAPRYPLAAVAGLEPWPDWPGPEDGSGPRTLLAASGLDPRVESRYAPLLRSWGLGPVVQAVAVPGTPPGTTTRPLTAGQPVAAVLVGGDLVLAGTGTVTLVEGDRVLALGHPLARGGAVDFPMARAEILVTVPSQAGSFKVAQVGEVVGAFHQDRPQGLAGRLGVQARTIPVQITVLDPASPGLEGPRRVHRFWLVRSPLLAGGLLEMVVSNTLLAHDRGARSGTISLDGTLRAGDLPPLAVRNVFAGGESGPPVAFQAARYAAALLSLVAGAPGGEDLDMALELEFRLQADVRQVRVEEVQVQPPRLRPGEAAQVQVRLRELPGGIERMELFTFTVPLLPAGSELSILAGDASAALGADGAAELAAIGRAPGAAPLMAALQRLRPADGLYLRVTRPAPGWLLGADLLRDLPPSVASVIRTGGGPWRQPLGEAIVADQGRSQRGVVVGAGRVSVPVDEALR